ncbi:MAG TPA: FAD-linked oxidase C-terminal domain-containing protein [Anaerolineales bacterium]|nr:FAD-linked oxidase C-terminal domain-containing protein [Anaerolineales bacterium]
MGELLTQFAAEVRKQNLGELKLDPASRQLYSTDASIYQIEPLGVAVPRHEEDLVGLVALAAAYGVPILPRGSGTSLAGQTIGPAVIIDFSHHLNQVLDIDAEERSAWVQPGLVLNALNRQAAHARLMYGPDPASSDRATFGGMLGNNSTGAHSISYGMTSDNVLAIDVVLADGTQARLESVKMQEAFSRGEAETLEGSLYREALQIREQRAENIKKHWPRTWRRASGYSLNYLLPWSPSRPPMWAQAGAGDNYPPIEPGSINLAPLLVGSEGSLAVFKRIKVRLVPRPANTVLAVLSYPSIAEACDAAPELLELAPSAIELIPQAMIRLARSVPAYARQLSFVKGDPEAILIVEFSGSAQAEAESKLDALRPQAVLAITAEEQAQVWSVRKVGLGLLMSRPGDSKPLPFIEDVAVPVEKLGEFVRQFQTILAANGAGGDFYAHASAGCLHVRPLINLKTLRGIEQMRAITQGVMVAAKRLGGAMSGEHGDGLSHGEWLEDTFGHEIVQTFRGLKLAADPKGLLNPGKVLEPQPMHINLRYGPEYRADAWLPVLEFGKQGGLGGAIEMCNGAGVCRKDDGVMCPSFQATREEMHSTRGRANLLRAMISTGLPESADAERAAHAALDLCLECKGCKAECPSGVDMAKLKYDFLHNYYEHHRRPLRDYLFGYIGALGRIARPFAPLLNLGLQSRAGKAAGERLAGLSAKRGLPPFKWGGAPQKFTIREANILFLRDPFTELFYPELGAAALKVLEAAGYKPYLLPEIGAGRTLISKGFLPEARRHARRMQRSIAELDSEGRMPILGIEPSEIYTLRDEYLDLLPVDSGVSALARRAYMLDEFLLRKPDYGATPIESLCAALASNGHSHRVLLHGHCYQKTQPPADDGLPVGQQASAALLSALGYEVEILDSGCCGMAGSFGYEAEHYELSMQIGEMALFPAVRAADAGRHIVASGVSCRAQIASGTGRAAKHPVSLIAERLPA